MSRLTRSFTRAFTLLGAMTVTALGPISSLAEEAGATQRVEVGQTAPDFTLPDPDGKEHAALALRGEKNLLLVFFRGVW